MTSSNCLLLIPVRTILGFEATAQRTTHIASQSPYRVSLPLPSRATSIWNDLAGERRAVVAASLLFGRNCCACSFSQAPIGSLNYLAIGNRDSRASYAQLVEVYG